MPSFELRPAESVPAGDDSASGRTLGSPLLLHNVRWFIQCRWVVVVTLSAAGAVGSMVDFPFSWVRILALAGLLIVANCGFLLVSRGLNEKTPPRVVTTWIWVQILFDLLVVTLLVHEIGSTTTFAPFAYLFHIALACIFFSRGPSLVVTGVASVFYSVVVALELTGFWTTESNLVIGRPGDSTMVSVVMAASAVFVWFVVWYLVSALSQAVREQDDRLRSTNEELRRAYYEKNQQVLVTTHDLKAPFAGIESNIQVLKYRFWDEVSEDVKSIIERIDLRAQALSERIKDILTLGDIRSRADSERRSDPMDVAEVVQAVLEALQDRIDGRGIAILSTVPHLSVVGDREQLCILLSNLISNAVAYSDEGGTVTIDCWSNASEVGLRVQDEGIGIRPDALTHIFDEYYRTKEASRFNRLSTGLGLAIVKEIARRLGLTISVTSELEKGTMFEVRIPRVSREVRQKHGED